MDVPGQAGIVLARFFYNGVKSLFMKRIFLVAGISLLGLVVNAQNLSLGPTAGFGHGWLGGEDVGGKAAFHPTYSLGGKLVYSFVSHWGISADLKFSSEGGTRTIEDNDYVQRLNFIRIPVQGIYFFGEYGDAIRPKISAGPSLGFLVGGKGKIKSDGEVVSEMDSKDAFKSIDFGLQAAAGANFRVARNTWLNTDITYYHGLINIHEVSDKVFNRGLGLNVGLTFGIGTVKPK